MFTLSLKSTRKERLDDGEIQHYLAVGEPPGRSEAV